MSDKYKIRDNDKAYFNTDGMKNKIILFGMARTGRPRQWASS